MSLVLTVAVSRQLVGWKTQGPGVLTERATATLSCRRSPTATFFYSPRIYPLLPRTLLVKAVLLPKMLLPECFIGRG